ncbi:MAG TPA: hypothetical protein PLV58_05245 [Campylobacterales bacterium]|nr:hypothetical protein [Campylobacterales bacterium]
MKTNVYIFPNNPSAKRIEEIINSEAFKQLQKIIESDSYQNAIKLLKEREAKLHKDTLEQIEKIQTEIIEKSKNGA